MSTVANLTVSTKTGRGANIALWTLQILLAAAFVMAGASKLAGAETMVKQFETLGLGQWFRYLTGALEVAAAILLLIPGKAGYGALLLMAIMLGAAATHIIVFKNSPAAPLVLFALASVIAWGRLVRSRTAATV